MWNSLDYTKTSSYKIIVDTFDYLTPGSGDLTGVLGIAVNDGVDDYPITEARFDLNYKRMYLKTSKKIEAGVQLFISYDAAVGDLRIRDGFNETEKLASPDFTEPCGSGWSCSGGAESDGTFTAHGYMYQYINNGSLGSRNFHVTGEVDAGSVAESEFYFTFGELSREEQYFMLHQGRTFDVYLNDVASEGSNVYCEVRMGAGAAPSPTGKVNRLSIKEVVPIQGDAIGSLSAMPLTNYLDTQPTHLIHFPYNETSGNIMTDDISGLRINELAENITFVPNGIQILEEGNRPPYDSNTLKRYGAGVMVAYFSATFTNPNQTTSANKLGLGHLSVNVNDMFDIQRQASGLGGTRVTITPDLWRSGVGVRIDLENADDPWNFAGSEVAGCFVINFEKLGTDDLAYANKIYLSDGTSVFSHDIETSKIIDSYDLSDKARSWWGGSFPIPNDESESPTSGFTPAHKLATSYAKGIYEFKNFEPSVAEIETFLLWLFSESRAGNKEHYPAWADKI